MIDTARLTDPKGWNLALRLEPGRLTAMLYGADRARPRETRSYDLDDSSPAADRAALEAVVYDHPVLLSDFAATAILFDTPRFVAAPLEAAPYARALLAAAFDDISPADEFIVCPTGAEEAAIYALVPQQTASFLRRTFPDASMTHPLAALAAYFSSRSTAGGNGLRLYAALRHGAVDIVALDRQRLVTAATHRAQSTEDCAYFILAALQSAGAGDRTECFIAGDTEPRNKLMSLLRSYLAAVMPVIIPADAHPDPALPFDLNILPLIRLPRTAI